MPEIHPLILVGIGGIIIAILFALIGGVGVAALFGNVDEKFEIVSCQANIINPLGEDSKISDESECQTSPALTSDCLKVRILPQSVFGIFADDLTLVLVVDRKVQDVEDFTIGEPASPFRPANKIVNVQSKCIPKNDHSIKLILREKGKIISQVNAHSTNNLIQMNKVI